MEEALSKTLFIDIETVPLYNTLDELPEKLRTHWLEKYDKKRKPEEADEEKYFQDKAGIHAAFSRVACIGLGWLGPQNGRWVWRDKVIYHLDERKLLLEFSQIWQDSFLEKEPSSSRVPILCGHNLIGFDYVFLGRRFLLNELPLVPPWNESLLTPTWNLRAARLADTMLMWSFHSIDRERYIKLEVLAYILGFSFEKSLDHKGIQAHFTRWQETGDSRHFEPVVNYCREDIRITAKVYLKLMGRTDLIPYVTQL